MEIHWDRLDEKRWQGALPDHAAALQQSWHYGVAIGAVGGTVHRAEICAGGSRVGLVQMLARRRGPLNMCYLPRGPIWTSDIPMTARRAALIALQRSLPVRHPRLLIVAPEEPLPGLLPLVSAVYMAELPLSSAGEMRRRLHGKWRNRLVVAERGGLHVTSAAPSARDLAAILEREHQQQLARRYRNLPIGFLSAWPTAKRGRSRLFRARFSGRTVAEMLFFEHAPGVSYQIGWSDADGRATSAHNLLMWQAMSHYAREGYARLDLGTLETESAPGLARFKLGTGAGARVLGRTGLSLPHLNAVNPFNKIMKIWSHSGRADPQAGASCERQESRSRLLG